MTDKVEIPVSDQVKDTAEGMSLPAADATACDIPAQQPITPVATPHSAGDSYWGAMTSRIAAWLGLSTRFPQEHYRGKTALVTGAWSGIGAVFAEELAKKGAHLVLTARSAEPLQALAERLEKQYNIRADVIACDLATTEGPEQLIQAIQTRKHVIDILVNNAGAGAYGRFDQVPLKKSLEYLALNVGAAMQLTHAFLGDMRERRRGSIINVASIGGLLPTPYMATYAGTKAFLHHFTEILWAENRGSGVRILSLCPGPTYTPMATHSQVNIDRMGAKVENAGDVVSRAFAGLESGVPSLVTSRLTRVQIFFCGLLPRSLLLIESERLFRKVDARPA